MSSTSRGEKILRLLNIGIPNNSEEVNDLREYETQMFTQLKEFDVTNTCFTTKIADNMEYDQQNSISAAELDDNIELEDEQPMKANPLTEIEDNIMIDECMNDVNDLQEYETQMFTELKEFDVTNTCFTTEIADNMEYDQQNSISTADNIELEDEQQMKANPTTETEDNIMIDECMNDDDYSDVDVTYIPPFDIDNSDNNSDSDSTSSINSSSPIEKLQKSNKEDGQSTLNRSESILEFIDAPITDDATKKDLQDIDCMKSRKRKRNSRRWKTNEAKAKRNLGKEYINVKGKTVNCRNVKPPCNELKCRLKCSSKVTEDKRKEIFDSYWDLGDINRQREFIVRHVTTIKPKYRYVREGSNRSNDHAFHLRTNNERVRVCKTFFMSTLDVTNKAIRTAIKKHSLSSGVVEGDKRGTHKCHPTIPDAVTQRVKDHINSFTRIPSHYLRAQTSREYLEGNLTIAEMHRMFNKESEVAGLQPVSYPLYANIFNNNFNLGFFKPKKDLCAKCEAYKNAPEDEKVAMGSTHTEHLQNKNLAREHKLKDTTKAKEDNSIICACFDLQAVLQTPSGDASLFYYKRKLSTFNFTIYNTGAHQGFCFVWNEAIAKRGSNEIGSCLLMFLERECKGKDVIFYSDNCVGQNKNKYLASLYLYAVQKMGIKSITHKYLEVGHTQNEGDMMHSLIENQKKRQLKRGTIYVPSQWITVLQNSKKTGKPFEITELTTRDVIDLKKLSEKVGNNYLKNTEGEKVPWSQLRIIRVVKEEPFILQYKTTFSDYESSNFSKISVRARTRGKADNLLLDKAYSAPPPISAAKKKDLLDLCRVNLITAPYHAFYEGLNSSDNTPDFFPNDAL